MANNIDDLSGRQFGVWKVLNFDHIEYYGTKRKTGTSYYLCECVKCHNRALVARSNLKQNKLERHYGCNSSITKTCAVCGKTFETRRIRQITCSEECSHQNHLNKTRITSVKYREKHRKKETEIELEPGCKKTSVAYCKNCKYYSKVSKTCDYTFITKKNRNCKIGQCDKFEKR